MSKGQSTGGNYEKGTYLHSKTHTRPAHNMSKSGSKLYSDVNSKSYARPSNKLTKTKLRPPVKYVTGGNMPWWVWLIIGLVVLAIIVAVAVA